LPSNHKSKMLSLSTKTDRTLFFDFLPLDLGKIRGMRTKLQLYTVPGQVYYNSTRQLVLKGADGVVFVADSQDDALDGNLESIQNLEDNLKRQGTKIKDIPMVVQYNKRDLPNALSVAKLNRELNKLSAPHFESVATTGVGVEETLTGVTQLVLSNLVKKYGLEGTEPLVREVQILNPPGPEMVQHDTLWDDEDPTLPLPSRKRGTRDADEEEEPELVSNELPMASIEIPLPDGILDSLPDVGGAPTSVKERRAASALVKEVTVPLTLTTDELRRHRKLRLKITVDVTIR
jgi:signal recognition particle receptor subunit beta